MFWPLPLRFFPLCAYLIGIDISLKKIVSEQVGASDCRVRQVQKGRSEAVRTSIRRIDGGRRSPDDQVWRNLHLSENIRRSERKTEDPLRMHADGLHHCELFKKYLNWSFCLTS